MLFSLLLSISSYFGLGNKNSTLLMGTLRAFIRVVGRKSSLNGYLKLKYAPETVFS
jgi:hypothetical protein